MINRWKVLPHRRATGQCIDCGHHDARSAPDTCPRCAIESYRDRGFFTIANPVTAFELQARELWRLVAQDLRSGKMRSGRFYIWIGHGDGGPLERPLDELVPGEQDFIGASRAHEVALQLARRHPQVWIVTTVGGWDVVSVTREWSD